jgi:hypothetical protein
MQSEKPEMLRAGHNETTGVFHWIPVYTGMGVGGEGTDSSPSITLGVRMTVGRKRQKRAERILTVVSLPQNDKEGRMITGKEIFRQENKRI